MLENENLVLDEGTEKAEQPAEERQEEIPAKTYTDEEVNQIVGKKLARQSAKIRKEYERKYGELETVLKAGTGKETVEEMTGTFRDFYEGKGISIPRSTDYSAKDIEILAKAEAKEIIDYGFEEVIEEANRLQDLGVENMTAKDKAVFLALTNHIKDTEASRELSKIGVTEKDYNSQEFKDFASKFNQNTPIKEIWGIYNKQKPKQEFKTMGSMKSNTVDNKGVKEYYSFEEASKFTKEDFDKNPELFKAVERSMTKW